MKKLLMLLVALVMSLGTLSLTTALASADTTPSCAGADTTSNSGNCADIKSSSSQSEVTDAAYGAASTHGKILLRYNFATGIKLTASEKSHQGCKLVHKASQIPAGAHCIRAARGFTYTNSGVDQAGHMRKFGDSVGSAGSSTPTAKWMLFVKRGSQWYKAGSNLGTGPNQGNCGNKVWFSGPKPKLPVKMVILVRSWANWVFVGHTAVQASAIATATSKSWCNESGSSASATATGSATSKASASASYRVKGLSKMKAWISGESAKLKEQYKLQVSADAQAKAIADALAQSSTKAACSGSSGSTPPPAPAPEHPSVAIGQKNDVDVNDTASVCADYSVPGSDSATLTFGSSYGSYPGGKTFTVSGSGTKCTTYQAPSEVPSGGHDTLTVALRDSNTGLSDDTPADNSTSITINPAPQPPL